jgi:GAF domain-containing protein
MREVTEQVRSQRRLALADEPSARIGTTLDITRTAEELLEVAVPRLADAGAVDLLVTVIEGGRYARDQEMRLRQAAARLPADLPPPPGYLPYAWSEADPAKLIRQRLVAGLPVYLPAFGAMTEQQIKELGSGTGFSRLRAARRIGAHSVIMVPLTARGVIMGIVALCRLAGTKPFTAADLDLARDFVSRAAVSIDNARLYTRERATALALQHGLLPRQIPEVPGLEASHTRAGRRLGSQPRRTSPDATANRSASRTVSIRRISCLRRCAAELQRVPECRHAGTTTLLLYASA